MKSTKGILCAFLAVLTLLTLAAAGSVRPAYAAKTAAELEEEQRKAAQIAALEQKKKEQQEKLKELEKQIAEAKAKKEDVMVTKNLLDQRNQLLLEQIDDTQNQIDDAAAQIARYELLEQEQYELFCQQVRSEEERGSLSYLSVLFKATSMADLLNRMEFVNEVAEYNKTLIAAMKETRENIKAEKTEMEAKEAQLGEQQDELQGKLDAGISIPGTHEFPVRFFEAKYVLTAEPFPQTFVSGGELSGRWNALFCAARDEHFTQAASFDMGNGTVFTVWERTEPADRAEVGYYLDAFAQEDALYPEMFSQVAESWLAGHGL